MSRSRAWFPAVLTMLVVSCATGGAPENDNPRVEVITADAQDVSPALRDLAKIPVPELLGKRAREAEPWRAIPHPQIQSLGQPRDPVVQDAIGQAQIPSPM